VTSTVVGLIETGLKNCLEPRINSGVSGLRLPLLYQNCPAEPLDARAMGPGLLLSRTQILTLSVPSSSPRTLTKRSTGRRTDSLTLLLLGPSSRLMNLEPTPATGGLIVGGPGGHGSTLGLLLSASLLLRRFNHELLALPLVATHHVGLNELATAAREGAATRSRRCPGDGTRRTGRRRRLWTVAAVLGSGASRRGRCGVATTQDGVAAAQDGAAAARRSGGGCTTRWCWRTRGGHRRR
jgi:hypothetical protein